MNSENNNKDDHKVYNIKIHKDELNDQMEIDS